MKHIIDFTDLIMGNLDKEESENIRKHIETCQDCLSRYHKELKIYQFFTEKYSVIKNCFCPSEEFIENYLLGNLDKESAELFLNHFENCENCRQRLELVKAYIFDYEEALKTELPGNISDLISSEKDLSCQLNEVLSLLKNKTESNYNKIISFLSEIKDQISDNHNSYAFNNFQFNSRSNEIDIKIPQEFEESLRSITIKIDEKKLLIDEMDSGNMEIRVEQNGVAVEGVEINIKSKWETESILKTDENGKIRIKKTGVY